MEWRNQCGECADSIQRCPDDRYLDLVANNRFWPLRCKENCRSTFELSSDQSAMELGVGLSEALGLTVQMPAANASVSLG